MVTLKDRLGTVQIAIGVIVAITGVITGIIAYTSRFASADVVNRHELSIQTTNGDIRAIKSTLEHVDQDVHLLLNKLEVR